MGTIIMLAVIVVGAGLIVWKRSRRQASTAVVSPPGISQKALAHNAFTHGNTCLSQGEFANATAAFQQVIELEPKHPHVAGRLAEVARRQQEAGIA